MWLRYLLKSVPVIILAFYRLYSIVPFRYYMGGTPQTSILIDLRWETWPKSNLRFIFRLPSEITLRIWSLRCRVFSWDWKVAYFRYITMNTQYNMTIFISTFSHFLTAHRAILAARCEYFNAMFRKGGMIESSEATVHVSKHEPQIFTSMLEFIYSNSVMQLFSFSSDEVMALMSLANEYLIEELKTICVQAASLLLSDDNIGKFLRFCDSTGTVELKEACGLYLRTNMGNKCYIYHN